MADTRKKRVTMQGLGTPVSAAGKTGPQASSSCDRSSTLVGNLANVEYKTTRRKSLSHDCDINRDVFCYICCKYEVCSLRKKIDDTIKIKYHEIFGLHISEHPWVPNIICNACKVMFNRWEQNKNVIKYSSPAEWNKPLSKNDCFFCSNEVSKNFTTKNKHNIVYKTVSSVKAPIVSDKDRKESDFEQMNIGDTEMMEVDIYESESDYTDDDTDFNVGSKKSDPILVSQPVLNDLVRDLGLPKDGAEYLASFLKQINLLETGTKVSVYRNRESDFHKYFCKDEDLVYCTDINGLMNEMKENCYKATDWRLFIDSSKRSIKAVLLHNTNIYAPIPIAHSTIMQEKYENMVVLLKKIGYNLHRWQICGDLKIITMLLGQQSGFTKYPCYLCLWDSRDRQQHYKVRVWPTRTSLTPGSHNVTKESLVDPSKILIPLLHIKLGLMKQFVKALDKTSECFKYLQTVFPRLSEAKIKEGIFDGPQIRKLFKDNVFTSKMNSVEKAAWLSFREVAQNFLGNQKSPHYKEIVEKMIDNYEKLGCLMNLKLHFLHSHLDKFPDNLGHFSEEQGERFHQDMKVIETRYQGRWDVNMLADFCWMLKRETLAQNKKRKKNPIHRSFEEKRTRYSSKKEH